MGMLNLPWYYDSKYPPSYLMGTTPFQLSTSNDESFHPILGKVYTNYLTNPN